MGFRKAGLRAFGAGGQPHVQKLNSYDCGLGAFTRLQSSFDPQLRDPGAATAAGEADAIRRTANDAEAGSGSA